VIPPDISVYRGHRFADRLLPRRRFSRIAKYDKAVELGVLILDEDGFRTLLQEGQSAVQLESDDPRSSSKE
jgi:hypothetical protein